MSATKKATGSVSMTWDDFEPTMCPLEQGIAILYCAMDYACPEGYNHALKHRKAKVRQACFFAKDELGTGDVRFTVTPMNCFGARGKPLVGEYKA